MFIKVECDKQLKSADVKVYHDWNKSGKRSVEHLEEGTYYFDDVVEKHTVIKCDLGDDNIISVAAGKSDIHPGNDNVGIELNDYNVSGWLPVYPASETIIQWLKPDDFQVSICKSRGGYRNNIDFDRCEVEHIINGKKSSH